MSKVIVDEKDRTQHIVRSMKGMSRDMDRVSVNSYVPMDKISDFQLSEEEDKPNQKPKKRKQVISDDKIKPLNRS